MYVCVWVWVCIWLLCMRVCVCVCVCRRVYLYGMCGFVYFIKLHKSLHCSLRSIGAGELEGVGHGAWASSKNISY